MLKEDDLSLLGLRSDERRKLEAMGIRTLEQIAIMNSYQLGLGNKRGDAIIQSAQNILINRHVTGVELNLDSIPRSIVVLTDRRDEVFMRIISNALYADFYKCRIERRDDGFILTEGEQGFKDVVKRAEQIKSLLEMRARVEDRSRGVTLPREEIVRFARERGFDHFWKTVFEEIRGNEVMKIAMACSMFSSPYEPIHTLVVGDPASAKTMAKDIIARNFSDVQLIGANSTAAGLVMNRATGELGALAFSDGKIVLIDEFDKIPSYDIEYTYELLSNGRCRVDAARIHETIESHFSAIALANPEGQAFRPDREFIHQIGLPPSLMSRFALIVRAESIGGEELEELVVNKLRMTGELRRLGKSYDQWVKLARMYQPEIKASDGAVREYSKAVRELVEKYQATPLRRDARMCDYARRLPLSIARSEFRDVEDEDLERSLDIFRRCIDSWFTER